MDEVVDAIVAVAAIVLVCVAVWRVDRLLNKLTDAHIRVKAPSEAAARVALEERQLTMRERELALEERRLQHRIANETAGELIGLRKAELGAQTAAAKVSEEIAEELKPARLDAERSVIAADAAARSELAEEFARADYEAGRKQPTSDIMQMYTEYVQTRGHRSTMDFEEFVRVMVSNSLVRQS